MSMATVLSPVSSSIPHLESDTVSELVRWIPEQLRKGAVRIVLAQKVADGGHHTVDEWTTAELDDARALAEVIYATAMRDAQALKTALAYGVFAMRMDRPEPVSRMYFRVDAGQSWMQSTDTPDERGVTAMLMRHTEASARLSLGHSRGILDQYEKLQDRTVAHLTRLLDQACARVAVLEAREIEALEMRDKLQTMSRERELELANLSRRTELERKAIDGVTQFADKIAPLLLAKLGRGSGAALTPNSNVFGAIEVLVQFIRSITPEQFNQIGPLLRPEQMAFLAHLYDVADAHTPEPTRGTPPTVATAAAAPPATPSPEPPSTSSPVPSSTAQEKP